MTTPLQLIIRILEQGEQIKHKGMTYAMGIDGDICWVDDGGIGRSLDMSVIGLKSLAEEIGQDELWLKACAIQLKNLR